MMSNRFGDGFIYVAGGGFFGKKACSWFRDRGARVLVVDVDEEVTKDYIDFEVGLENVYSELSSGEIGFLKGDAVDCFLELNESCFPDVVVPAVPGHFLGKVFKSYLEKNEFKVGSVGESVFNRVVESIPKDLVLTTNPIEGVLVTSYMQEGRCLDDCPQPIDFCTVTKEEKDGLMNEILIDVVRDKVGYSNVLVSHGLNGVGYLSGDDVQDLLSDVDKLEGCSCAVGTSCGCHGIMNLMKVERK
ncbi:hypothetical protein [Methanonatronarchaeum sp. AMET-Sl]|uniref:hypothetical protein n=1 Tax=Methanonatronarchaeum sp. AMET-Sl TaxID=3037654 RepID=UPI00244DD8C0|nr:hypothetical protein [Methanonatronarchaeum sp. AMET-Sl]WGI17002.1 hypothetical protein QEN48_05745 [Methanonatronarchaeum sp. AMET-Sl]